VEFGGEHDVLAAATGERLADDGLRLTGGVHVCGVDEIDAGVQGVVDDPDAVVVVRVAAEHHGAQTERADLHSRASEVAVLGHRALSLTSSSI
jgi:hypothetical protein